MPRKNGPGCSGAPSALLLGSICLWLAVAGSDGHAFPSGPFRMNGWQPRNGQIQYGGIKDKRSIGAEAGPGNGLGGGGDPESDGYVKFRDVPPKLVEARQRGRVELECSALGSPAPRVAWFKNGRPVFKESSHKAQLYPGLRGAGGVLQGLDIEQSLGETRSKISFQCLSESDAGVYECIASNGKQKKSVMTEISVSSFESDGAQDCRRSLDSEEPAFGLGAKPMIHESMAAYMQTIGYDALLACRADGPHETYWYTPSDQLASVDGAKYQMTANGDLIVRDLTFEDMGIFRCAVRNTYGEDSSETFVYPMAPS